MLYDSFSNGTLSEPALFPIYLRKSRGDPENETIEETLEKHKEILLEFAKRQNLSIGKIYYEVVSGDGLFVRPEMMRLMNDIENGMYSGVLCMDIDRLGRVDTKDRGIILETFKDNNIKIVTPAKTYDLSDEIDEFSTEMQMLFARQELKKITKRLRVGINKTAQDGYHVGEPPYGYRRTYVDKKPTLEIYEEEANVVRMVFDMYVNQHIGSEVIARTLNNMGYSPRKSTVFNRTTIQFYLSNPIYIGKIVYNKKHRIKRKLPTDKFRYELNPKEQWIVSDGVHPAIIDKDLFDEAQRIRKERYHPPSFTGNIMNPFAGMIFCANCGSTMLRQTSKKTPPRLLCTTIGCNKSTVIWKIEDCVLAEIETVLEKCKSQGKIMHNLPDRITPIKIAIADLKKQLSVLQGQMDNLYDLLEQGIYDVKTFTDRSVKINARITEISRLIKENEKQLYTVDVKPRREEIIPLAENLLANYDSMSAAEKNMAYKKIIKRIEYRREKVNGSEFELKIEFNDWL